MECLWDEEHPGQLSCESLHGLLLVLKSEVPAGLAICKEATGSLSYALGYRNPETLEAWVYMLQLFCVQSRFSDALDIARKVAYDHKMAFGVENRQFLHGICVFSEATAASRFKGICRRPIGDDDAHLFPISL